VSHQSCGPETTDGQAELEPRSWMPCRTVSRRCCKSLWMRVAAEETNNVATASVESEIQEGRSITETRPTRLNLHRRSVRRLTDKLVGVGAKKIDGIPTHPQPTGHPHATAVRMIGKPKGWKSHQSCGPEATDGQALLELRSRVPCSSSRQCHKSLWMRVAAEETNGIATASVESESQEGRVVSDEQPFPGTKSNVEVETTEFQSGIDVRKGDKPVADSVKLVSDDQNASKAVEMRPYNTLVVYVLFYGAETWTLVKSDEQKLEAFQMSCLRWILGLRWFDFMSNTSVTNQTQQESICSRISSRRHSIFGHVRRLCESAPAHECLSGS